MGNAIIVEPKLLQLFEVWDILEPAYLVMRQFQGIQVHQGFQSLDSTDSVEADVEFLQAS